MKEIDVKGELDSLIGELASVQRRAGVLTAREFGETEAAFIEYLSSMLALALNDLRDRHTGRG